MLSQFARQRTPASHLRLLRGRSLLQSSTKVRLYSSSSRLQSIHSTSLNSSPQAHPRRPSFQSSRSLATAADQTAIPFESDPYPSEFSQNQQWSSLFPPPPRDFDPSSLIIVNDVLQTKPKVLRKMRGIGGDEEEMMANLDISLKVSRFDRAASLINRLREYHPVGSPGYLVLHNRYLEAMVSHIILTREHDLVLQMQRWFEVDMPYGGVEPDATTFAIMIRMALRMFHGSKRDRSVRRYWAFAKNAGVEEEVLAVPILSELELGELSEICSSDLQRVAIDSMAARTTKFDDLDLTAHEATAEVRPVEQKGLGLSSLKESLSMFSTPPTATDGECVEDQELYEQRRQEKLEAEVMQSALNRWRQEAEGVKNLGLNASGTGKRLGPMISQWHTELVANIKEELKLVDEAEANPIRTVEQKERCEYGVYLRSLDADKLAALTILTVMGCLSRGGMEKGIKVSTLVSAIGSDLYDELMAEKTLSKQAGASARRMQVLKEMLAGRKQNDGRAKWQSIVQDLEKDEPEAVWSAGVKAKVGAVLMSLLFDAGKAPVYVEDAATKKGKMAMQPAFQHSYQIAWGRRSGYIHIHPEIVKIATKEPMGDLLGRHLPMICKPRPWKGFKDGAYFLHKSNIVRSTPGESLQPTYIKAALENNGLEQVREGLDILGSTGWTINHDVFNVMLEAWNTGDPIADIAPLEPDLPHPTKPSPEEGYEAEKKWDNLMRDIENRRSGFHSQRCFQNFQMEVARAYLNETFYLPHNMDFRGRAYPLPPYLNQMGADNARGLLLFSKAKPLGDSGLKWLKIQIANLSGYDKASLSEREQFTMDHLDDVLDSANNGLHGRRWWLKAEDPWQCLAACCELRNALQHAVPTEYASRLPIHQDGSCNGLQHYAALGGDSIGAQQVNLEPSDRPSDVYSGVAEFVKTTVATQAAQGHPIAKMLNGKITRKVVKQTVMTNVYGVTFMGAMKQVRKQLVDLYPDLSREDTKQGALYIARKIFQALGTMFNGAHDIQYWLGDSMTTPTASGKAQTKANDPTKAFRSTVIWTTPLGLPVVQPYRVRVSRRITTSLQALSIVEPNADDVVSKRKQLQAFPPNFIHSLDATHMIMSATACHRAGLSFSAVHDSFWTHACDVDSMNQILREAFVRMHSDHVIKRLAAEFEVRYGRNLFYAKVPAESRMGKVIKAFRKGQKNASKTQELLEEYKRQNLLKADDPELQAQGRAMVTAGSVFEQAGGTDHDLAIASSLGETVVGHVPEDLAAAERKISGMEADPSDPALETLLGGFNDVLGTKAEASEGAVSVGPDGEQAEGAAPTKKKKEARSYVWLWLPLRFREVPKKGEWDLTRIRNSQYFFS
ncbi:hypothetical protein ARAM_000538 [Aspergillus rambellii]|uniref:DNA-directed RNA polymerase n=1 Tax=Aspergillus rambellii TaxID=308745 RepID=A0A0F8UAQ4_9EURO|nr:hypothetical protein ARAM_000538 [Aspergillus rambellii]